MGEANFIYCNFWYLFDSGIALPKVLSAAQIKQNWDDLIGAEIQAKFFSQGNKMSRHSLQRLPGKHGPHQSTTVKSGVWKRKEASSLNSTLVSSYITNINTSFKLV